MIDAPRIRVLVATRLEPVEIENLEQLPAGLSVACIGGTNERAGISQHYRLFVARDIGVIAERFGHDSFRLDISSQIDEGKSWQLGAFIAHAAHHAGRLARKAGPADIVILATGQVHRDDSVASVGFLSEKIAASLRRLSDEREAGRRLIVAWPKRNEADVDDEARAGLEALGVEILELEIVEPALEALGLVEQPGRGPGKQSGSGEARKREGAESAQRGVAAPQAAPFGRTAFPARATPGHDQTESRSESYPTALLIVLMVLGYANLWIDLPEITREWIARTPLWAIVLIFGLYLLCGVAPVGLSLMALRMRSLVKDLALWGAVLVPAIMLLALSYTPWSSTSWRDIVAQLVHVAVVPAFLAVWHALAENPDAA